MRCYWLATMALGLCVAAGARADDLSQLDDEFDDSATLGQWQRVWKVEQWPFDQLESCDIDKSFKGCLVMAPYTCAWYREYRGPLMFKQVNGDFVMSTRLRVTNRDGNGPPRRPFSLAGIMIRAPRSVTAESRPPNGENYVFLSMGCARNAGQFEFEAKTTVNSDSRLTITRGSTPDAIIQAVRVGGNFIMLTKTHPGGWRVHQRFHRPDLPSELQVGLTAYTDWPNVQRTPPRSHNMQRIHGQPDLRAIFDYVRFRRPDVPPGLQGRDLSDPGQVSDRVLVAQFGERYLQKPANSK